MIDVHARIQINRESLKKIVKMTAESKRDKKRIKELEKAIQNAVDCGHIYGGYSSRLYKLINNHE